MCVRFTATMCATDCNRLQHTATNYNAHCNNVCKIQIEWEPTVTLFATHCNTLQHTATYVATYIVTWSDSLCVELQHSATHCNTLQHTATHCNTLLHTAANCNTLQYTATRCTICNILQQNVARCNRLQQTAAHCNTPQHTATHCNTLQHTYLALRRRRGDELRVHVWCAYRCSYCHRRHWARRGFQIIGLFCKRAL